METKEYPSGRVNLADYGPTWTWFCFAELYPDGTAEILLHDRLRGVDHSIAADGRFDLRESTDGERTVIGLEVFRPDPEVEERGWHYRLRNPQHAFSYGHFSPVPCEKCQPAIGPAG